MRELLAVWRDTRAVVMVAVTAALYAAVLIPMKVIMPLVPGFTEVRPANVLPVLFSFLFGPVAAWGAAFGNIVADLFGTFGPGSFFGFFGNFLYGLIPYRVWRFWSRRALRWEGASSEAPQFGWGGHRRSRRFSWPELLLYAAVCSLASAACGIVIAWGVDLLGFVEFRVLANLIFLNNIAMAVILGPPLLASLGRRVRAWGLGYSGDFEGATPSLPRGILGTALVLVGAGGGLVVGNLLAADQGFVALAGPAFSLALLPFLLAAAIGALLL
jgi:energy-coupling factor transport system substrate-specific component